MGDHFYRPGDGHRLAHDPFNSIVAPRPIGWIGTRSPTGVRNLAPYSFFNAFNYTPPIIGFSSNGYKNSAANAEATGVFTWNLVSLDQAGAMNATSAAVEPDVDEFALAGLEAVPGTEVDADRVVGAPVTFECRLSQQLRLTGADGTPTDSWLTLGEVVGVHIDERFLVDGVYQTADPVPVVRGGGPSAYYAIHPESRFDLTRPD